MVERVLRGAGLGLLTIAMLASIPLRALAATRTWSATPANGNWNNTANWDGGVVPVSGDDLVFPAASTVKSTNNDIAGLGILSITFNSNDYTLAGNAIALGAGGITCTSIVPSLPNRINFDVTLAANSNFNSTCQIQVNGVISGAFGWTKHTGTAELELLGANIFTGAVSVTAGVVRLGHDQALGAGEGTVATGTSVSSGAAVVLTSTRNIANERISLQGLGGAGFAALTGGSNSVWGGPIVFASDTRIHAPSSMFTLTGPISGPGGFESFGGTLVISAVAAHTGATEVIGGTLLLTNTGALFSTSGTSVASGATLAGIGSIATPTSVAAVGTIAPGIGAGTGQLTTDDVTFSAGSTLRIKLNGPLDITNADRLNVNGALTLGGSTLDVALNFDPGGFIHDWLIVTNDGADPVVGTFNGLPEGAQFNVSGRTFMISYTAGSGNDIELRIVSAVPTMDPWVLLVLALLMGGMVLWQLRRMPRLRQGYGAVARPS